MSSSFTMMGTHQSAIFPIGCCALNTAPKPDVGFLFVTRPPSYSEYSRDHRSSIMSVLYIALRTLYTRQATINRPESLQPALRGHRRRSYQSLPPVNSVGFPFHIARSYLIWMPMPKYVEDSESKVYLRECMRDRTVPIKPNQRDRYTASNLTPRSPASDPGRSAFCTRVIDY